jgi:hypothetical protein
VNPLTTNNRFLKIIAKTIAAIRHLKNDMVYQKPKKPSLEMPESIASKMIWEKK